MPELPEIETICRQLVPDIVGRTIKKVRLIDGRVVKNINHRKFSRFLKDKKISSLQRRAKYIFINLSSDLTLLVHLGMTGTLIFRKTDHPPKYTKVIFALNKGFLYYADSRLFGKLRLGSREHIQELQIVKKLGPEPFDKKLTPAKFWHLLKKKNRNIKVLLMDQSFIAGVGNIYASEALFRAGISPYRKSSKITRSEARKLLNAIRNTLHLAISHGGSSVDDFRNAKGEEGNFQNLLKVYDRKGEPCFRCRSKIKKTVIGQRGTYYCPKCQK